MYVDFHSHILPKADHGSNGLDMSLSQLEKAAKAGVDTIVATPHFYIGEHEVSEFLKRREDSFKKLSEANKTGIRILKAAEVQIGIGLSQLPELAELCIEGTNYILLEFPPEPWPYWIYNAVEEIKNNRGLIPVLAHIDRYSAYGRKKILKLGAIVQINASAFSESLLKRRAYSKLVSENSVHLLGSDVHGDGEVAYREFSRAVKRLSKKMLSITENSRKILATSEKK